MASETQKPSITFTTLALMVAVALLFDALAAAPKLLDFVPFLDFLTTPANVLVGSLVSIFAYLTFWFWFHKHGIRFIKSPKRLLTFPVAFFIKLIPFLGALPAWTGAVIFIFLNTRAEDLLAKTEMGAKVVGKAAKVAGKLGANKEKAKEIEEKAKKVEEEAKKAREQVAKAKKGELGQGGEEQLGSQHYADTMQALGQGSEQRQGQVGAGGTAGTAPSPQGQGGQSGKDMATELSPYRDSPGRGKSSSQHTKPAGDIGGPPVFHPSARESGQSGPSSSPSPKGSSPSSSPK